MKNVIYATEKKVKSWTEECCKTFFNEFSNSTKAKKTAFDFIQEAYDKTVRTYYTLPKLICNTIQYTISAFWKGKRFCITIMNPRNGNFGKAILNPIDKLNISYGIALAYARMKKNTEYQVMKRANEIELKNGQIIYDSNYIPFIFVGYYPTNKDFGVLILPEGKLGTVVLKDFYAK
jgi:hypothetical protein